MRNACAARGPAETVVSGRHAGLDALARGRALLLGGLADRVIVVGVEVDTPLLRSIGARCEEGAVGFVLERRDGAIPGARILGGACAFGDSPDAATQAAIALLDAAGRDAALAGIEHTDDAGGVVPSLRAIAMRCVASRPSSRASVHVCRDPGGGAACLLISG